MLVQVETYPNEAGDEKLRWFCIDDRVVEVADTIDQWPGADYRYVKVSDGDGNVYILRHNDIRAEWELTMYQRARAKDALAPARHAFAAGAEATDENMKQGFRE